MTNQELLQKYKDYLLARSFSLNYYYRIRIFLKFLEEKKLDYNNLAQENIVQFLNEKKYNEQSKNSFINAGRDFYEFLGQKESEWNKFKLSKVARKIPEFMPVAEIQEVKKYLVTYYSRRMSPIKIRTLIDFLFETGARKGELLILKRADINLEEKNVKFFGKGKKERFGFYGEETKAELMQYFSSENEEFNAFNITLGKLNYIMKILKKFMGKRIYTHLFRHSFSRDYLANGGNLEDLKILLGHSDIRTTEIYAEPNYEQLKSNYNEVQKIKDKRKKKRKNG